MYQVAAAMCQNRSEDLFDEDSLLTAMEFEGGNSIGQCKTCTLYSWEQTNIQIRVDAHTHSIECLSYLPISILCIHID